MRHRATIFESEALAQAIHETDLRSQGPPRIERRSFPVSRARCKLPEAILAAKDQCAVLPPRGRERESRRGVSANEANKPARQDRNTSDEMQVERRHEEDAAFGH